MNRLKILLITSALIASSSALASAEEYHQSGLAIQVRFGNHDGDRDRDRGYGYYGYNGYRDGDRDRDDRNYRYVDRDHRWRDRDDHWRYDRDDRRRRDWDHDDDRR